MKVGLVFATLAALIPVAGPGQGERGSNLIAKGIAGTWELALADPNDPGPLPQASYLGFPTTLALKVDGKTLTGSARMGRWPGKARISSGKIDGERITFTMIGELEYCQNSRCALPIFHCTGTADGGKIEITIAWGQPGSIRLRLKGQKISD